jgi:signal transduction histidine kinase
MILNFLTIIAGIISITLAVTVLVEGTSTKAMRIAYAMFAGSVGLWAIFLGLFLVVESVEAANTLVFAYYSLGLLIPYSFLFFTFAYLSIRTLLFVRLFALLPWVVMTVLISIPGIMVNGVDVIAKTVDLVQPMYIIYSLIFILYVAIGLWLLITKARRAKGKELHQRVVAVSLFVGFVGGGYFDILLPLFGNYSLIVYGPLFAFITSAGIFYVIARHGLFDIRQAVLRTLTYILSLGTLTGAYLFVAFIIFNQLLGQTSTLNQTILNVSLTLVLAFAFQPIKKFFDRLTNKLFYKDSYTPDYFYARLNEVLSSTTDLRSLLRRTSVIIAEILKAEGVSLEVYVGSNGVTSAGTEGCLRLPRADLAELEAFGGVVIASDENTSLHLRRIMKTYRLEIAIPISREGGVIGFLCLGEHKAAHYTRRDLRSLMTISDELAIAIQNALSMQDIRDLNANLEQRIDAATKELRKSNAQLQRLDEAKDEFISMASHQLRTPLTSIKGYISMMMEGDVGKVTPEQIYVLSEAFISSERMVRLIGDFLNVSRLQTGKFIIDKHPVDLAMLVEREIESLTPNAGARGMKFVYKMPKHIPLLQLDENKIQQVVMNFCDNALYYSKDNGEITVSLKKKSDCVEFTVKDSGIGVPAAEQAHLFNKFFRATNARRARPDGTGVGLFLAKKVVDAHDGAILFSSKEGKGSTFGFRLPLPNKK